MTETETFQLKRLCPVTADPSSSVDWWTPPLPAHGASMTERRYSDEEMALILRQASRAPDSGTALAREGGITLPELKEIAREVGIDPGQVELAAARLESLRPGKPVPLLGTPVAPQFEREVPVEVREEHLGDLVTTIRRVMERRGITNAELGTFEWRARDANGGRYVSIRPGEGSTSIRVFGNFRDAVLTHFLGGGIFSGLLTLGALGQLGVMDTLGLAAAPIVAGVAWLTGRTLWRWRYKREAAPLAELAEELDAQVRALAEPDEDDAERTPGDP